MAFVVVISGLSGSGKTTLADALAARFHAECLCLDNYYFPTDPAQLATTDFESPSMIDAGLAASHIQALGEGQTAEMPLYDYERCCRVSSQTLCPSPLLIVEGQYSAVYKEIRKLAGLSIFLDIPPETCLVRRLARDRSNLRRSESDIRRRFEEHVLPTYARLRPLLLSESDVRFELRDTETWADHVAEIFSKIGVTIPGAWEYANLRDSDAIN